MSVRYTITRGGEADRELRSEGGKSPGADSALPPSYAGSGVIPSITSTSALGNGVGGVVFRDIIIIFGFECMSGGGCVHGCVCGGGRLGIS